MLARDVRVKEKGVLPLLLTQKHTHDALAGVDVHINGCAGRILDVIDKEEKDKEWVEYACLRYYEHRL